MKFKIKKIYLSWRKGKGSRRKIVGVIERTATNGITFKYLEDGVKAAQLEGFKEYNGFPIPHDFKKIYNENDLDIFSLRLIPFERKDNKHLLKFWEAEGIVNKFDLLALTQGLLPTDNFEFLGLFNPAPNFKFVTDIAGLTHLELEKDTIIKGDILRYDFEANPNAYLDKAVKVYKSELHVGYIKNIHNNIFVKLNRKLNRKLKLVVKEVEQNGIIKNIFVQVTS
ncbi:MAG TPA: hypothetical protein DDX39_01820 [Bacteroidales bacterium]|nr:MAG: hypothetical protein A2W98_08035 [Bacteroidetes bacterium GWF2_33_38]OFY73707.1 MAG: hypothetical protein A2265_06390 [Bacteroidetes bacterium RIFOXYA12_FULL_33_9]HBF87350.1 hypothetical protein [Bacteroidales bacterium]